MISRVAAAPFKHVQVHQHHPDEKLRKFHGLHAVRGLADDLHIRFHGQEQRHPTAHQRLILGNDDSNHLHPASVGPVRPGLEVTFVTC